jgi:hypothetical protein
VKAFEFVSPRPAHSATSQRESVKLVPEDHDVTCSEMKDRRTRRTYREVDRLWDVRDEDRLLLAIDEETQRAR